MTRNEDICDCRLTFIQLYMRVQLFHALPVATIAKKVVVGCDLSNGKIGRGYPKSDDPTVFIVWRNWIQYVKFSHSGHSSLICSITSFLELVTSSHFHLTACPNYAVKKFRTNKLFKYVKVSLSMVTNDTISGPL